MLFRSETPYLMYRVAAEDEPQIVELPFRPAVGAWWNGRLYLGCLPGGIGSWTGLASWAPGEAPRQEYEGPALFDIEPDADSLILHPRTLAPSGAIVRDVAAPRLRWYPDGRCEPIGAGAHGPRGGQAMTSGWSATSCPESDLVLVDGPRGSIALTCYWPQRVAWIGRSLLVSTVDWDVLLFEDVMDHVEALAGGPARLSDGRHPDAA